MGTGRTLRKESHVRPCKTPAGKARKSKAQRARLVKFGKDNGFKVTFYGDEARSQNLYPQDPFKKCKKGEIGVTNQSRPHHGLIGIRLQDSKQYGPTGEEAYGTNLVGTFLGDLAQMELLDDDEIIYVTEAKL